MSNFRAKAFNPASKRIEDAEHCDNYYGRHRYGIRFDDGCVYPEVQCGIDEAATAIDALIKERDALRSYADELFRENGIVRDMLLNPNPDQEPDNVRLHREKCDAIDRAFKAEQERDALQARVKELDAKYERADHEADHFCQHYEKADDSLKRTLARALRAEQERDEAYERLKPFAAASDSLDDDHSDRSDIWESPSAMEITAKHLRAARDLLRQLAGPEKEGE